MWYNRWSKGSERSMYQRERQPFKVIVPQIYRAEAKGRKVICTHFY
jgi:hypothetical protein